MLNEDMARDMGANRTFRSIFGGEEHAEDGEQQAALESAEQAAGGEKLEEELRLEEAEHAEEDGMWSDADNNEDAAGAAASDTGVASNKSMADWADDDDDEEVWKDALQARVNQLELVFQTRGQGAAAPASLAVGEEEEEEGFERPQGLTNALRTANDDEAARGSRHKIQRTARGRAAQASSSSSHSSSSCGAGRLAAMPPPSPQNGVRKKRTASKDFIARNIQAVELKRSVSGGSSSSRTDSPSSSAAAARLRRKGSVELTVASPTTSSTFDTGRGSRGARSVASVSTRGNGAVFDLSETEAIRRFVVNDIKQMSMERLVNNAKRLHFLEEFYKHHAPVTTATSSTAAAAPLSPCSSRSDAGAS